LEADVTFEPSATKRDEADQRSDEADVTVEPSAIKRDEADQMRSVDQ
jgi:hypothetical protein